jgi:[ribosomal protein S18]-alanine N-acetyltransferase
VTDDIDQIMAVMAAAFDPQFGEAWTRRQVEDALLSGLCHYRLAGVDGGAPGLDGTVAGFYLSRHVANEEELLLIAVTPVCRGSGAGSLLLRNFKCDAVGRGATRLLLEMREDNPAESLYLKHGFKPIGLRRNYYRTGLGPARNAVTFACNPGETIAD